MQASRVILTAAALLASALDIAVAADDTREHAIAVARESLAKELGIDVRRISVGKVEAAYWRDGSLGCPQPGMSYMQVLVNGYRVLLSVGSATYDMRVAEDHAVRCNAAASKSIDPQSTAVGVRMAKLAREDLATRLKVEPGDVATESIRPVHWPDASLQCPESKDAFTAAASGFVIRLNAKGRQYAYHADHERVVPCGPLEQANSE